MTRINVVPVEALTDQHLMAEYRELPMVLAAALRSSRTGYKPSTKYTLNTGHVKFFYNKKKFLLDRYQKLIDELRVRGYNVNPDEREVDFSRLDKFDQVDWAPDEEAIKINKERIDLRISEKPDFYKFWGYPLNTFKVA